MTKIRNRIRQMRMAEGDPGLAGGTAPAAPAAPAAGAQPPAAPAAPGAPAAPASPDSLLQPTTPDTSWLPEKLRVMKEDGTLDQEASLRKTAEVYGALEKKLGSGDLAPKDPAEYVLKAADGTPTVDFDAFKADPLCQGFLKGAHGKGMTNDQVNYVLNEYIKLAPGLLGASQELDVTEARAELGKLWTDPQALDKNLASVSRAIEGFGGDAADMPGSKQRLFDKYGRDPDFIAFAAAVATEMGEDKLPTGGVPSESDIESVQKSKAYWDPNDPGHAAAKAKVDAHYKRKFG